MAGELSYNSLISEIFVSSSEKIRQAFLLNAYAFRDFLIYQLNFQEFFYTVFSTLILDLICIEMILYCCSYSLVFVFLKVTFSINGCTNSRVGIKDVLD
jgi:hypothetical protein